MGGPGALATLAAGAAAGACVLLTGRRHAATGRIRRLSRGDRARQGPVAQPPLRWADFVLAAGAAAAVLLLLDGPVGVVGATLAFAAAVGARRLGQLEVPDPCARDPDLPLVVDLLAAGLSVGAPLPRAADVVARALPGPAAATLAEAGRLVALGAEPRLAYEPLQTGALAPVGRALVRSARTGAPVADQLARAAAEIRAARTSAAEEAAARVEVLAVIPLGLFFLPGFVLIGIVPVVVGLAAAVLP